MNSSLIIPLREAFNAEVAGGKAANLAKMMQAGLPVPNGFVVTIDAYKLSNNGTISEQLAEEIHTAYHTLNATLVAARSSANMEDMIGSSMAGQYETCLNLSSYKELIAGIKTCWQSIQSDRAQAYLKEHNIAKDEVAMAVVVQELVPAEVAGVLFTADPRNGCRDSMHIEAAWGLGESIVSGEVQPDSITIHNKGKKIDYKTAPKTLMLAPGEKNFRPVDPTEQKKACLNFQQIVRLHKFGTTAEQYFKEPQDIEWAIQDDQIYILQSRPITTLLETDAYNNILTETKANLAELLKEGQGPWVRHNIGETLQHPTPLTWEQISYFMSGEGGYGKMYKAVGFSPSQKVEKQTFLKKISGDIYMDCSLMSEMFAESYPFRYDVDNLRENPDSAQLPPTISTGNYKQQADTQKQAKSVAGTLTKLAQHLDKDFYQQFIPELEQWCQDQHSMELENLSDGDLIKTWHKQSRTVMHDFSCSAFMPSMIEVMAMDHLKNFLTEHSWDEKPDTMLLRLSVSQKADCTLKSNIELSELRNNSAGLEAWVAEHGHRAPGEFDLSVPRWSERPEDVLQLAQQMTGNLEDLHEQRKKDSEACIEIMRQTLSPQLFETFQSHVDLMQRYCRFREDGKYYFMKAYAILRLTALEFGKRLGIRDDIFFLKSDEIATALKTKFIPLDKISARKIQHSVEKRLHPPHVIDESDIAQLGQTTAKTHETDHKIDVHSLSSGTCTGSVAIVHSPDSENDLKEGSILVCTSTDPSWTPLFAKASGLILERGGSLSHGAVVAREMGLPAVVIDGATTIFKDAEKVTINANTGHIFRGEVKEITDPKEETEIPYGKLPPPISSKEKSINKLALFIAIIWGAFLGIVYLLPPHILHDPIMSLIDKLLWPLVRNFGMISAVALIGALFAFIPILLQKICTDNRRLLEAKKRSAKLQKEAKKSPPESPRHKILKHHSAPMTMRLLKAAMVPLAFILGPMMMIFMWFPERVDPLSWQAKPGRMISIVAEIDGEIDDEITLNVPSPLSISGAQSQSKTIPNIRQELEELRAEWHRPSNMESLPWEVQSAGDYARQTMNASLNTYLNQEMPPQKLSWLISIPVTAYGAFPTTIKLGSKKAAQFNVVLGNAEPIPIGSIQPSNQGIKSIKVNYPRPLSQNKFCTPLASIGGPSWDIGWLGVYLLSYLPLMFVFKALLKVP